MRVGRQKNAVVAETSMTVTVVVVVAAVTAAAVLRGGGGVGWSRQSPREGGLEGGGGHGSKLGRGDDGQIDSCDQERFVDV